MAQLQANVNDKPREKVRVALKRHGYEPFAQCIPYDTFNKVQTQVLPLVLDDNVNTVLCTPTGTGKTTLLFMGSFPVLRRASGKVLYIVPTKELAREKQKELDLMLKNLGMQSKVVTGDITPEELAMAPTARIIVATFEKWLQILKSPKDIIVAWMQYFRILILDEVHYLGTVRGPAMERMVARLALVTPHIRILAASATIPNAEDVQAWLGQFKPTTMVNLGDEWKEFPIDVMVHAWPRPEPQGEKLSDASSSYMYDARVRRAALQILCTAVDPAHQVIIFVNTQSQSQDFVSMAAEYADKKAMTGNRPWVWTANDEEIDCIGFEDSKLEDHIKRSGFAWLHAGMDREDIQLVRNLFDQGKLKGIASTTFTAPGVNTPAVAVIIANPCNYSGSGDKAMVQEMSLIDVAQMMGRCGRPGHMPDTCTAGLAVLIVDPARFDEFVEMNLKPLESYIRGNLAQCFLQEIVDGVIKSVSDIGTFLSKLFYNIRASARPDIYTLAAELFPLEAGKWVLKEEMDPSEDELRNFDPDTNEQRRQIDYNRPQIIANDLFGTMIDRNWVIVDEESQLRATVSGKALAHLSDFKGLSVKELVSLDFEDVSWEDCSFADTLVKIIRTKAFEPVLRNGWIMEEKTAGAILILDEENTLTEKGLDWTAKFNIAGDNKERASILLCILIYYLLSPIHEPQVPTAFTMIPLDVEAKYWFFYLRKLCEYGIYRAADLGHGNLAHHCFVIFVSVMSGIQEAWTDHPVFNVLWSQGLTEGEASAIAGTEAFKTLQDLRLKPTFTTLQVKKITPAFLVQSGIDQKRAKSIVDGLQALPQFGIAFEWEKAVDKVRKWEGGRNEIVSTARVSIAISLLNHDDVVQAAKDDKKWQNFVLLIATQEDDNFAKTFQYSLKDFSTYDHATKINLAAVQTMEIEVPQFKDKKERYVGGCEVWFTCTDLPGCEMRAEVCYGQTGVVDRDFGVRPITSYAEYRDRLNTMHSHLDEHMLAAEKWLESRNDEKPMNDLDSPEHYRVRPSAISEMMAWSASRKAKAARPSAHVEAVEKQQAAAPAVTTAVNATGNGNEM